MLFRTLKIPSFIEMLLLFIGLLVWNGSGAYACRRYAENHKVYYIDSRNGDDGFDGRTRQTPWRSLNKTAKVLLNPGDSLRFKKGSQFTGTLRITSSGNAGNYITLTDYGDPGAPAPCFTNRNFEPEEGIFGNCIRLEGSYIKVENLVCRHTVAQLPPTTGGFTTMWQLGAVHVAGAAEHCIVRNVEFEDCGAAIRSNGRHTLIEYNYIHDCNRVLKEWSWGPIGIWLGADFQEVAHNRIFNYSAVDPRIIWGPNSYGGGADGGAIEIDDARNDKSHISIHHNQTKNCQGFLEVTGKDVRENANYRAFSIHHNISDDYQQFIALWRGAGCRIDHNTIIRRKVNANEWGVFNITQYGSGNMVRNNLVVTENGVVIFNVGRKMNAEPRTIIENNLYFAASGKLKIGLEGPGEEPVFGDPEFKDYNGNCDPQSFSITEGSPAIDAGTDLGYRLDFSGRVIREGERPDIGAYEYIPDR